MENLKESESKVEDVKVVDVELNEEQLEAVSGGVWGDCIGGPKPVFPIKPIKFPDVILPPAPGSD